MKRPQAYFQIIHEESTEDRLVIRDLGPWDKNPTITNDAEGVVRRLYGLCRLWTGKKLFYYDSDGRLDEIVHKDGEFVGFKAGWLIGAPK